MNLPGCNTTSPVAIGDAVSAFLPWIRSEVKSARIPHGRIGHDYREIQKVLGK
jgi:hypothetical protein